MASTNINVDQIRPIITPIAQKYGVKKVYLFGSYAKGTATVSSDIDLLIEKGLPLSLVQLSGLRQEASEALGVDVDLVTMSAVSDGFKEKVQGTEILIYEA